MNTLPAGPNVAAGRLAQWAYGCWWHWQVLRCKRGRQFRSEGRRPELPDALPAAVAAARLPSDEDILAAPFGD